MFLHNKKVKRSCQSRFCGGSSRSKRRFNTLSGNVHRKKCFSKPNLCPVTVLIFKQ